jgi:hypothetical protein
MPIQVEWTDDTRTIQMMEVSQPWTWDDMAVAATRSADMAGEITHDYYFIVDFSNAGKLPGGAFTNMTRLNATKPKDKDTLLITVIGVEGMLRRAADMFMRVFGRNIVLVNTKEEAFTAIEAHKASAAKA